MKRTVIGILFMMCCLWVQAQILTDSNLPIVVIEIDGGVNTANAAELFAAGADVLVAGSAVFGAKNPEEAIRQMKGEN